VSYGNGGEVFIGRDMAQARDYSESTAQAIDAEVRAIVEAAHNDAYKALTLNRKILDALAKELMERETLNQDEIAVLFKNVKKIAKRKVWLSSRLRPASKQGPIAIPSKGSTAAKQTAAKKAEAAVKSAKSTSKRAPKTASKPRTIAKKK
jgi:cell division protease FtsH